ncbi:MAG TPA: class I SAM-dependent methyltransferase [Bryobacteraceae bacterium]|nr:class I SAM-dependent methyltransferase [Bryobacteraceae bacterium]
MEHVDGNYLPAAGRDWALPLYDPLIKLLGAEAAKRVLLKQAGIRPKQRVLDIGCGTGTLAILVKKLHPDVEVTGLDPDPKALARSKEKARRARVSIRFDQGFSEELPYPDGSFDRVLSSLMLHHLKSTGKEQTLREVRRVLAPGGSLHLLDFEQPEKSAQGLRERMASKSTHLNDNSERQILAMMRQAGFDSYSKVMSKTMLFGLLHAGYYQASNRAVVS